MYKYTINTKTTLDVNISIEGETIEKKVSRLINNKEPLKEQGVAIMYSERKAGVLPESNIRTDRFEIAVEAMDKVSKSYTARRENNMSVVNKSEEKPVNNQPENNIQDNAGGGSQ